MNENLTYQRVDRASANPAYCKLANTYCEGYKKYIDTAKTEREAVCFAKNKLDENGFAPLEAKALSAGDKVYYVNRKKSILAARIGKKSLNEGIRVIISHVDSPRLDLKQLPLYEEKNIAYLKTHYYGGLKKYQWTALPLAIHGVIFRADGTELNINIGDDDADPVFYITDLMPHIAKSQMEKKLSEAIEGETLNIVSGSLADTDGSVKNAILALLYEKYKITERDFITAELTAVPAQKARDVGFDRSMIAAYGQDDRICSYPSLTAFLESESELTTAIIFADKEEIGSYGVTGMTSDAVRQFVQKLCAKTGADYITCIEHSICLSADVGGAFDPCYASVYEEKNSAYINRGVAVVKYTGARGKSGCNDAPAELVSRITRIFDEHDVVWQCGEYGKVDEGGAGTVASDIAMMNMDVIDCGVPILSMHAPVELAAKSDIYMMHLACAAFFKA